MNTQEFLTQISATPDQREVLEIIASASPLRKLEGWHTKPLEVLRSPYLENPYVFTVLLRDLAKDHYAFRPYVKALKGIDPENRKDLSILYLMMALSIEVEEPLVSERVLYPFRKVFAEDTLEAFGLYCYLLYFSFPLEGYPALEKYEAYTAMMEKADLQEHFPEQFSLLQFLFQGNPLQIGKGDSGGLSTFLLQLGKALTRSMEISRVYTLSLMDISRQHKPFSPIQRIEADHFLLTVPFHRGEDREFIKSHSFLKAMVSLFLKNLGLNPNIYHVRYLNQGSLAMAKLAKDRKRPVVLTLTPDPQRSMRDERKHKIIPHDYQQGIDKIHRMEAGREIINIAGGILGIGGKRAKERLVEYYPELKSIPANKPFAMISEGVDVHLPLKQGMNIKKALTSKNHRYPLDPENVKKPFILNVGRLHPMKGQEKLLKAFYRSRAYEKYNLVIIGGDFQRPNREEQDFLRFEKDYLEKHRELWGSYVHIPGIPNNTVRLIQRKIHELGDSDLPNMYFCSSRKEEFGIAILEAMVEGYIAVGPEAGGVSTYIRHGENGFLGKTEKVSDLEESLCEAMDFFQAHRKKTQRLKENSVKTIKESYSMEAISLQFADFYREVLGYEGF